jgi:hypothetical protein
MNVTTQHSTGSLPVEGLDSSAVVVSGESAD